MVPWRKEATFHRAVRKGFTETVARESPGSQGESLGKGNGTCKGPGAESSPTCSRHRGRGCGWKTRGGGEAGRTRFLRAFLVGPSPIKKFKVNDKCDGKRLGFFK